MGGAVLISAAVAAALIGMGVGSFSALVDRDLRIPSIAAGILAFVFLLVIAGQTSPWVALVSALAAGGLGVLLGRWSSRELKRFQDSLPSSPPANPITPPPTGGWGPEWDRERRERLEGEEDSPELEED